MPIYLVRWPDLSAALVRAGSEDELPDILDQVANPEGCEWSVYEGPLFIDFRLPVEWRIDKDERPAEPVTPQQLVISDIGPMATCHVAEGMELSLAGDDGYDTAKEIVRTAFPELHAVLSNDEVIEPDGVLAEAALREALHAELTGVLRSSWRRAQLQKKTDLVSAIAREVDMPPAMVQRHADLARSDRELDGDGDPVRVASARRATVDKPLLRISNHHLEGSGQPPALDGDAYAPGVYCGYFTNGYGEQAIYVYDHATGEATLRLGDAGRDSVYQVIDGRADGLVLSKAEKTWLSACWMVTGALDRGRSPHPDDDDGPAAG